MFGSLRSHNFHTPLQQILTHTCYKFLENTLPNGRPAEVSFDFDRVITWDNPFGVKTLLWGQLSEVRKKLFWLVLDRVTTWGDLFGVKTRFRGQLSEIRKNVASTRPGDHLGWPFWESKPDSEWVTPSESHFRGQNPYSGSIKRDTKTNCFG